MKKVLYIFMIICLLIFVGCNDEPNVIEDENPKAYEIKETIVSGVFYINKDNPIIWMELPFYGNKSYYEEFESNENTFKLLNIDGENTDKIRLEFDYYTCNSLNISNRTIKQNLLFTNIYTSYEEQCVVKIQKISIQVNDISFDIYTDVMINIVPNMEFAYSDNGSLLLTYNGVGSLGRIYSIWDATFELYYKFNDSERFFNKDGDYVIIDELKYYCPNGISIDNAKYDINGWEENIKSMDNDCSGNKLEEPLLSMNFKADYLNNDNAISYFSLIMKYHFNYDNTERYICFGNFNYSQSSNIFYKTMEKKFNESSN